VPAEFDDLAALEYIDAVGVHDRRKAVSDQNRDRVAVARGSNVDC